MTYPFKIDVSSILNVCIYYHHHTIGSTIHTPLYQFIASQRFFLSSTEYGGGKGCGGLSDVQRVDNPNCKVEGGHKMTEHG